MIFLPLFSGPFYTYSLDIDDDAYEFTFRYSDRANSYLMDIVDAEGEYIIRGVKLLAYVPLLRQYALEAFEGDFVLIPRKSVPLYEAAPENPREIYKTHLLIYATGSELSGEE